LATHPKQVHQDKTVDQVTMAPKEQEVRLIEETKASLVTKDLRDV